jgi:hypothetical protein
MTTMTTQRGEEKGRQDKPEIDVGEEWFSKG